MPGSNRVAVILCFKCCLPPGWRVVAGQACCPGHVVLKRSSYGLDVKCPQCLICLNISSPASSAILGECEAFGKGRMAGVGPWGAGVWGLQPNLLPGFTFSAS